jgi:ribonuclease BN (tRNA processing enzyme)
VVGAWGNDDLIDNAFELEEYDPAGALEVGGLRVRFGEVPHFTTTYAIDFSSSNGRGRFTYGADCRPCSELIELARDTDLLMVEATLPRPERTGERGHMTPAEAGEHARRAGARRVVLTHISDELDQTWARDQGRDTFGGSVEVAREGAVYEV